MTKTNDKKYCVYKHTAPNGKSYIGITSMTPQQRWANGNGYKHNLHFTNAIEKYGWDNFTHEIIADNLTQEEACEAERKLIDEYDTFNPEHGYNLTTGGEIGKQYTDETRQKQSILAKQLWQNDEYKKAHEKFLTSPRNGELNPNYGNHKLAGENHPNYGKKRNPETIEKMRYAASHISNETRKKMSEAATKRMTPEFREHLRKLATGRTASDESRKKMSDSQNRRWNDELRREYSDRFSGTGNPMYGKHHSDETKRLLSEMFSGENSAWFGRHHTDEEKQKAHDSCWWKVPVIQLTLQGEFVKEFDSYTDAAKEVNGKVSAIIGCCNGDLKSAYGYMWLKKNDYNTNNIYQYTYNNCKAVIQLTEGWEYIAEYETTRAAAKAVSGHHQNIGRICKLKGNGLSTGYRWMYKQDYLDLIENKKGEAYG